VATADVLDAPAVEAEPRDDYLAGVDPETWAWADYLLDAGEEMLADPECRRWLTCYDPLLFACVYLRHHLASKETGGRISISDFHIQACRHARTWCRTDIGPTESRTAWVAPRGSGKSTWFFLILPLWALAHGHRDFIAAFADAGAQAEQHLMSFKHELDTNELLRQDFADLCTPAKRPKGQSVADRQDMYIAKSGAAFLAKGIDSSTLGAKIENRRPDVLLFDDIEPDESNYSEYQKGQRLGTVRDAVMPMNLNAVVELVGTTVMQGSIIDDVVRQVTDKDADDLPDWPREENIDVKYFHAIITNADGTERSLWPQRWTLKFLDAIRHTASFLKNFANRPATVNGWWNTGDIRYDARTHYDRTVLVVDGAVTAKTSSDQTGLAVVGVSLAERKLFVREAVGVRLTGEPLRQKVLDLILDYDVDYVLVEANQGGDLWYAELHDLPVKMATFNQHEPKPVRIKRLLGVYQRSGGAIFHEKALPQLETQQRGYPKVLHEDVLDATAAAAEHLVAMIFAKTTAKRSRAAVHQFSYR
jgi:hypothetical protein